MAATAEPVDSGALGDRRTLTLVLGLLAMTGSVVGSLVGIVRGSSALVLGVLTLPALLLGGALISGRLDRLPHWSYDVMIGAFVVVDAASWLEVGVHGNAVFFYFWAVPFVFVFLPPVRAAVQVALIAASAALVLTVLYRRSTDVEPAREYVARWLALVTTCVAVGIIVRLVARSLTRQSAVLTAVVRSIADAVIVADRTGAVRIANPAASHLFRRPLPKHRRQHADIMSEIVIAHPDGTPVDRDDLPLRRATQGESVDDQEFVLRHPESQDEVYVSVSGRPVLDERGTLHGGVVIVRDISDRLRAERHRAHAATHDALTDLPNRALLMDRLVQAMARAARADTRVALLFIDLDRFKEVNDTLGHAAGDALLLEVARRLRSAVREVDTVARLGGDEFVVLCESESESESERAGAVADRIRASLAEPIEVDGHEVAVRASIGIAYPTSDASPEDLLRHADAAMYEAKRRGRGLGRVAVFDRSLLDQAQARLSLDADLRQALRSDEFRLVYQPVVDASDSRPVGVEALLRWESAARGPVPPAVFMERAEETGLIVDIGRWAIDEALRQWRDWSTRLSRPDLSVSVNLSGRQLADRGLEFFLADRIATHEVPPGRVHLEVTESALMQDVVETIGCLHRLKRLGVVLEVDDFGTGYSSMSYLRLFPVDVLKIDRTFVAEMTTPRETAAVKGILGLAHGLGLTVQAEGVEHEQQARLLTEMGCERLQGFLYGRPMAGDEVEARLLAA